MEKAKRAGQDGKQMDSLSRRQFLTGTGRLAVSAAAGAGALGLASCAQGQVPIQLTEQGIQWQIASPPCPEQAAAVPQQVPEWPWPYVKLDPEAARKKGHQFYYEGACCYGAFMAIMSELQEKVGSPYTEFPVQMMRYGEGGVEGWATLCGAINGACAAITLTAGEDYKKLVNELVGWYTEFPFPSDQSNQYAAEKIVLPEGKPDQALVSSVSGSPLCHVSVTKWCEASGFASKSPERAERCARLAGDVAARAIELLNQNADQTFEASFVLPETTETCRGCHFMGESVEEGQFTRGKMECTACHEGH